jgi:uncharacterized protein YjbJ (UPF0337 family)
LSQDRPHAPPAAYEKEPARRDFPPVASSGSARIFAPRNAFRLHSPETALAGTGVALYPAEHVASCALPFLKPSRRINEMGVPNKDEMEGKYEQVKGSVKEGLGNATGDEELRSEGSADKLKGDVQEGWGGTKRKVGDMLEDAGDAIKR